MDVAVSRRQRFLSNVVLWVLFLERLAYYALVSTFFLFLNKGPWSADEGWDSLDALNAVFVLLGVSYISALMGGYSSDAWIGRYWAIVSGMVLYLLGYGLLILITVDKLPRYICSSELNVTEPVGAAVGTDDAPHAPCKAAVYLAVVVLGTGVGMVKANIGPFGAEQMGPTNQFLARSFFNWYYWCVNLGSAIGIGLLAYVEQDNPGICTNGFFCGYSFATGCLALALCVMLLMMPVFERYPATGSSPLFNIVRITWEATRLKIRDMSIPSSQRHPPPLVKPKFLDLAKVRYGGRFHETAVDDVRAVGSMLTLFAALLPYWLVYFQMQTSFQAQGLHMRFNLYFDRNTSNSSAPTSGEVALSDTAPATFSIPAAWLTLFNQAFLIIALPVLTNFVYPYFDRRGIRLSMLFRIGVGMFVSSLAVFTAGGLETFRTMLWRTDNSTHIEQTVGNATYNAVDLSIFWQVPQYMLVAAAEALASVAGLEYAYSEAPRSFQSLIMGLFYAMEGVGSFLGIALLQILAPIWLSNMTDYANINDNHLDFYLYFLGIVQFLTLIVFIVVIYVSRFSLELVPLHSDQGIGGPMDRRGHAPNFRYRGLGNEDDDEETYEERLRRRSQDTRTVPDDEELIDVTRPARSDLLPDDDSDDSVDVKEAQGTGGGHDEPAQHVGVRFS